MRLIVGAQLDPEDHEAVVKGYEERKQILEGLARQFEPILTQVTSELFLRRLEALQWLVAHSRLDIKVALRRRGMYHEKIGIMKDEYDDFIVFQGSANESLSALSPDFNYESINVFRSWKEGDRDHYEIHKSYFEKLWGSDTTLSTVVIDFPEYAKNVLLKMQFPSSEDSRSEIELADAINWPERSNSEGPCIPTHLSPFKHQRNALTKWHDASYCGILNHATGAGKTFTSIYGMSRIFQHTGRLFALVAVPYQALADQWVRELKNVSVQTILCSSVNPGWQEELSQKVDSFRTSKLNFASAVVVNATLITPRFQHVIARLNNSDEFLFIGDECHHHGALRIFTALPENAGLRLGLSATYERYGDEEGTTRLQQYYGPEVDSYPLRQAIEDGFLVPYEYHLELVDLNEEESEQYCAISDRIRERLKTLRKENPEGLFDDELIRQLLFSRARLLGKIESKRVRLGEIIDSMGLKNRTLIYCGEGSAPDGIDDNASAEELQNIDLVTRIVSSRGYRVTKFTSRESQDTRRQALEGFRNGSIQILTAIRCLDEGIDIPSCETAFVLASSRNPRQFIQRRGRILRRSPEKTRAILWDFLPLPPENRVSSENLEKSLLRREIGRISEFSRNSLNFKETYSKLTALLDRYDLGADFVLGGEDTK
jgi:superfamily II DNA or RNA helicase